MATMGHTRWTQEQSDRDERDEEIARLRAAGLATLRQLADHYGITVERVRQIAKERGVDPRAAMSRSYAHKSAVKSEHAANLTSLIVVRWMAGESPRRIARSLKLTYELVKRTIDENMTDDAFQMRQASMAKAAIKTDPNGVAPQPSYRRYWTRERVWSALVELAVANGSRLPTSDEYKRLSQETPMLPSFSVVRQRLGRWSYIRAEIARLLRETA